jgi:hypothetical protein
MTNVSPVQGLGDVCPMALVVQTATTNNKKKSLAKITHFIIRPFSGKPEGLRQTYTNNM